MYESVQDESDMYGYLKPKYVQNLQFDFELQLKFEFTIQWYIKAVDFKLAADNTKKVVRILFLQIQTYLAKTFGALSLQKYSL